MAGGIAEVEGWSERAEEDRHEVRGIQFILSEHCAEVFNQRHVIISLSAICRATRC